MKTPPSPASRIGTNELRFHFDRVLKAMKSGATLTLTYRNRPLARIVPVSNGREIQGDDPFYTLHELAEPMGKLTNRQMDKLISEY